MLILYPHLTTNAQCSIAGHLYDQVKKTNVQFAEIQLLGFPNKNNISTYTDSLGNYFMDSIPVGSQSFLFYASGYQDTIVYDIPFKKDSITYVNILYPTFCKYSDMKSNCPICLKKNKVIPIIYGYPSDKMRKKNEQGKIRLGGCILTGCDPKWYYKKDNKEF